MSVNGGTFAAEYYKGSKTRSDTLVFCKIANGERFVFAEIPVLNKRDARTRAVEAGAVCWNF